MSAQPTLPLLALPFRFDSVDLLVDGPGPGDAKEQTGRMVGSTVTWRKVTGTTVEDCRSY